MKKVLATTHKWVDEKVNELKAKGITLTYDKKRKRKDIGEIDYDNFLIVKRWIMKVKLAKLGTSAFGKALTAEGITVAAMPSPLRE